jgi:hypothetical protein
MAYGIPKLPNETVDKYVNRFKKLRARVDPTNAIPVENQVRDFTLGLSPLLLPYIYVG